jgi:hypothetical protein
LCCQPAARALARTLAACRGLQVQHASELVSTRSCARLSKPGLT